MGKGCVATRERPPAFYPRAKFEYFLADRVQLVRAVAEAFTFLQIVASANNPGVFLLESPRETRRITTSNEERPKKEIPNNFPVIFRNFFLPSVSIFRQSNKLRCFSQFERLV
jgi:hypothetical protein